AGRDFEAVIATLFHESPVPAENQAVRLRSFAASARHRAVARIVTLRAKADERRCTRTRLRPNRWESSLAAGWWRPVSALPAVSRDGRFDVKRGRQGFVPV